MKYLIMLVFCGSLALEANGARVRAFLHDSEKDGFKELPDTSARRAIKVKKRFEKQNNLEARWEQPKERDYEYEQSVVKILEGVKKIMTKGVPLLYPKTLGCGKGVALKCQYTPNKTEDKRFFGYQGKPSKIMMRLTDSIDKLVSHPVLRTYADMFDYSPQDSSKAVENDGRTRARVNGIKKFKLGKLLMFVKRIVYRDPEEVPQKFVCGIQMGKHFCKNYKEGTPANTIEGFRFDTADVNNAVKSVFTSREIMKGFIKVAKDVARIFPALGPDRKESDSDIARVKNTAGLSTEALL